MKDRIRPIHIFLIFLFLFVFSIVNSNATAATVECSKLFLNDNIEMSFDKLFPSETGNYPILSKLLTNKFYERSQKIISDPHWKEFQEFIENCSSKSCEIGIGSEVFSIRANVQIIAESGVKVLNIKIDHFVAANVDFKGKKKMAIGWYPNQIHGTSIQFMNLMNILFNSVHLASQKNPEISIVRISGISVVNNNLEKILTDLGFKPNFKIYSFIPFRNVILPRNWVLELHLH